MVGSGEAVRIGDVAALITRLAGYHGRAIADRA